MLFLRLIAFKFNIFRSATVNENINQKVKKVMEESKNSNEEDQFNIDHRKLDKENATLRNQIAKIWLLDIPLEEKAKRIAQLIKEEKLLSALTRDQKEKIAQGHENQLEDLIERNR